MPPIVPAPRPNLKKMTRGYLIGTLVLFTVIFGYVAAIGIHQILLNPRQPFGYFLLIIPAIFLVALHVDYLGELLRRHRGGN